MIIETKILSFLPPKCKARREVWMSIDPSKSNISHLTARLLDKEISITCEDDQETANLVTDSNDQCY